MIRVMFVDVDNMDKRRDHDRDVVREIIRVDVTRVSCPPHIAPGMTTAVYVYCSASGNNGLDLVAHGGAGSQIEISRCVGDSSVGWGGIKPQAQVHYLQER